MQITVAGVTHDGRQKHIRMIQQDLDYYAHHWHAITVLAEPYNRFDPEAIGIWACKPGEDVVQIGYVPRQQTRKVHRMMAERELEGMVAQVGPLKRDPNKLFIRVRLRRKPLRRGART